jgi:hypothetical protein
MRKLIPFIILSTVKVISHLSFRLKTTWVNDTTPQAWQRIRLIILLNHTSLFEPVFAQAMPWSFIWRFAKHGVFPVAEETLNRPLVGTILRTLAPNVASLTRKRDTSWDEFLKNLDPNSILIFAPEGRMKRRNGLDKYGKPMTLRMGIVDVMRSMSEDYALLAYSGGLHHVHAPGDWIPKPFKTIRVGLEEIKIQNLLHNFAHLNADEAKMSIVKELEKRRDTHCPS